MHVDMIGNPANVPEGEPISIRINGARMIDLGGVYVDPCDVVAVADIPGNINPPVIEGAQARCGITLFGFTNGSVLFSTLTSSEVIRRINAEVAKREAMVRARSPKPPTQEEIEAQMRRQQEMVTESMTAAMRAARKAADPDADAPWKQGD